ncbi:MAG: polysaccharide biosynthesis/export family protein [bacterium]
MLKWINYRMKGAVYYTALMIIVLFFCLIFKTSATLAQEGQRLNEVSVPVDNQAKKEEISIQKTEKTFEGTSNKNENLDPYLIGPEDILSISVWKNEDLNHEVVVRPDGKISFPLIGDIQAGGKVPEELRLEIAQRLIKFIPDPVVTVMVLKINSNKIYVIGNVTRPGEFILGRRINVLQALSMAGGLNDFASSKDIIIIRTIGKRQITIPFNYKEITKGSDTSQNIYLQSGDVIVVP